MLRRLVVHRIRGRRMIWRDPLVRRGKRDQPGQVVGGRNIGRIESGRIGERRIFETKLERLLVHPLDEGGGAPVRHARQDPGGGVVGRNQASGAGHRPVSADRWTCRYVVDAA